MGISRDSRHKSRASGGKRAIHQKKRKYELGRPAANTKLGGDRIHTVRTRGGHTKCRALRVEAGSFSWGSEGISSKAKIFKVVYNPTSNEFVRTNTVTRAAIVTIDATPFKTYYKQRYGVELGKAAVAEAGKAAPEVKEPSAADIARHAALAKTRFLEPLIKDQFASGRLFACISSRPGQSGRADGYILEGAELEFYKKKMAK